jgi:flagellar motor component MotA
MNKDDKEVLFLNILFGYVFFSFVLSFFNPKYGLIAFQSWFVIFMAFVVYVSKEDIKEIWETIKDVFRNR